MVTAVNDDPIITLATGAEAQSIREDVPTRLTGIIFGDVDVGETYAAVVLVTIAAEAGKGSLSLDEKEVLNRHAGGQIELFATLDHVNSLMDHLVYTSASNTPGGDNITISIDDRGNSGATIAPCGTDGSTSGSCLDGAWIAVTVTPENDPPTLSTGSPYTGTEDTT